MKDRKNHKHQGSHRRGEYPHLLARNLREISFCRLKSENYHGETGCTASPGITSIHFLQSKPK